ncbi:MAG: DJ-1/PfpI family protein, partial [Kiritimatiellae bacterium]|nr:DJ-1/PfpI family protein [Kiritimatiellia bacterium]
RRLRRQADEGRLLCAICAAPTVLVDAGVLDPGVHVTCYPTCQMELDRPWSPVPVVADGNVITGQAPGSAMLFALIVLQTLVGAHAAQRVAREMVSDVLGEV